MGQRLSSFLPGSSAKSDEAGLILAASMQGNLDEVKRLVGICIANRDDGENNNYVNRTDASGNAAIHGAVFGGHLEVLKFLVETCGANLTIKNGLGCSPLWVAAGYDKLDCLEYLIVEISKVDKESEDVNENIEEVCNSGLESALLDANTSGDTPLLAAASRGNFGACKMLLDSVDKYYAKSSNDADNELAKCILKRKMIRTCNKGGDTSLGVAVAAGHGIELLTLLLELDDEVTKTLDEMMPDATNSSSEYGDDSTQSTKCINKKNGLGLTPLIVSCERNLPAVAETLLRFGADIHVRDSNGRNLLAVPAFCGCNDVVEFLLTHINQSPSNSLLLNEIDDNGCTPIWLGARTGNVSIVKLLLEAGADVTIKNKEGLTPQEVAAKFKKEKLVKFFLETTSSNS